MKKGIVIALAIAVMFMFVSCGIQNQLKDTEWGDETYVENLKSYENAGMPAGYVTGVYYKFNADGTYDTFNKALLSDSQIPDMQDMPVRPGLYPSGKWSCEGNELHMMQNGSSVGIIYNASISGDTLTLEDKSGSAYMELYRIK